MHWLPLPDTFRRAAAALPGSVLLETAIPDGGNDRSFLFVEPEAVLEAGCAEDVESLFAEIERHLAKGRYVAGYFAYEAGESLLGLPLRGDVPTPLVRLQVYASPVMFHHRDGSITGTLPRLPEIEDDCESQARIANAALEIEAEEYVRKIAQVQAYLQAGDTYQVNFTDRMTGSCAGSALALYRELLQRQPVRFAAFLHDVDRDLLSLSPELFYRAEDQRVTVRPMKGTWPRGVDTEGDRVATEQLRSDPKNRSEHVTIVDLLRNDVGRVCKPGSVRVEGLFAVELYRTLLQMTSTISGTLRDGIAATDIFRSLFPSGSITGAPKRRTMEIIHELERGPRGVYTGAIGYFAPGGEACFNVAIRTLELNDGRFVLGVGGGITADSSAGEEYEECRLKARFLTQARQPVSLIETMRCEGKILFLSQHMNRLAASAEYFGIRFDMDQLLVELQQAAASCGDTVSRVRLEINEAGKLDITAVPFEDVAWSGNVLLSEKQTSSSDPWLRHKTTRRELYSSEHAAARSAGFGEVMFVNERGELTEGAISNVFVRVGERWLTPSLGCGVLPGVRRRLLMEELGAVEGVQTLNELQSVAAMLVCSSLRGIRHVERLTDSRGIVLWERSG